MAPKGLAPEVLAKANGAVVAVLNEPQAKDKFIALGYEIMLTYPLVWAGHARVGRSHRVRRRQNGETVT